MGYDIHAHIEHKTNGKWINYSALEIGRDYDLFRLITNNKVRSLSDKDFKDHLEGDLDIPNPRGMPDDISEVTKYNFDDWGVDSHSHGWLTDREMEAIEKRYFEIRRDIRRDHRNLKRVFGYLYKNFFDSTYPAWVEDVRLVFWFDN